MAMMKSHISGPYGGRRLRCLYFITRIRTPFASLGICLLTAWRMVLCASTQHLRHQYSRAQFPVLAAVLHGRLIPLCEQ